MTDAWRERVAILVLAVAGAIAPVACDSGKADANQPDANQPDANQPDMSQSSDAGCGPPDAYFCIYGDQLDEHGCRIGCKPPPPDGAADH